MKIDFEAGVPGHNGSGCRWVVRAMTPSPRLSWSITLYGKASMQQAAQAELAPFVAKSPSSLRPELEVLVGAQDPLASIHAPEREHRPEELKDSIVTEALTFAEIADASAAVAARTLAAVRRGAFHQTAESCVAGVGQRYGRWTTTGGPSRPYGAPTVHNPTPVALAHETTARRICCRQRESGRANQ